MKIEPKKITVRELTEGYADDGEGGVVGYGGALDIRPPYQREFIYKGKQLEDVIDTILQGFPLNSMYWAVRDGGGYEVLDGQQRTLSICTYVANDFSYKERFFTGLEKDEKEKIFNYELMLYLCSGEPSEKLKWFETINIAGAKLTNQELRNAIYPCPWLADAKSYFSARSGPAHNLAGRYLVGAADRQEYLETAIHWHSDAKNKRKDDEAIRKYMAERHKENAENAKELISYFEAVIYWLEGAFPTYNRLMKGLPWGEWYNKYKEKKIDPQEMDAEVDRLLKDKDVTNKKGIFAFLLTEEEKHLNIRAFDEDHKEEAYARQNGICVKCKKKFEIGEMEADHITPWSKGGKTIPENCQMLCKSCNRSKSDS